MNQRLLHTSSPPLGSEGFLRASASTQKCVLESHWSEEVPRIARHLQWPEVIFSYASLQFLPLLERLRTALKEQQEQSSSVNEMAQRRSFKEVLLLPRQPGAHVRHLDMKGANRGSYRHGYCRDVQPLSAVFADCRAVLTHCRIDLKGFKHKTGNSIIHIPEPPPGHFALRNSLLWFGFCF